MQQSIDGFLRSCTVRVELPTVNVSGTGFWVAPGCLITCAHVVERAMGNSALPIEVTWNNQNYPAIVTQKESTVDLALLKVEISEHPCVYLDTQVKLGDFLYLYGYPDNNPEGDSATFNYEGPTQRQNQTIYKLKEGQARPGMSGSPLLNVETGAVCGVVSISRDVKTDLGGWAVPADVILMAFPDLKTLQKQFHQKDSRWLDCLTLPQRQHLQSNRADTRITLLSRTLRVFLSYADDDLEQATEIYNWIQARNIEVWFKEENLLPGMQPRIEVPKAVNYSDAMLICLTNAALGKAGNINREIKLAVDKAAEYPESITFLVPIRLEKCELPFSLKDYDPADLFKPQGYKRLGQTLQICSKALELKT